MRLCEHAVRLSRLRPKAHAHRTWDGFALRPVNRVRVGQPEHVLGFGHANGRVDLELRVGQGDFPP